MKKTLILIAALCLLGVIALALLTSGAGAPEPTPSPAAADAGTAAGRVDFEALYESRPADSLYATVGEREIRWSEYYEWLGAYVLSTESGMDYAALEGETAGWASDYGDGRSLAETLVSQLNENFRIMAANEAYAAAQGVVIGEEELDAQALADRSALLGEDATEEDWAGLLAQHFLTERIYRAQAKAELCLSRTQEALYGAEGERLSAAKLQHFIEDYGFVRCSYLVFLTVDPETLAPLESDKRELMERLAAETAAELRAIESGPARAMRFEELAEQLCADGGGVSLTENLVFRPGTVPALLEEGCAALSERGVSEPLRDQYGLYVLLRLPVTADTVLDDGTVIGALAARMAVLAGRDALAEGLEFKLAEGAEPVDLLDYLAG